MKTFLSTVSSSFVRCDNEVMLVDCGEGTQHQILRSSLIHPGRIRRIFITHLHGDHLFGLPGLVTGLCAIKKERLTYVKDEDKLHIYGPRGVRQFLNVALSVSSCRLPREYFVHELCQSAEEAQEASKATGMVVHEGERDCDSVVAPVSEYGERREQTWELCETETYRVKAGRLRHTVACWGYAVEERDRVGALDVAKLLQTRLGAKGQGYWVQKIKEGHTVKGVTRDMVCGPTLK